MGRLQIVGEESNEASSHKELIHKQQEVLMDCNHQLELQVNRLKFLLKVIVSTNYLLSLLYYKKAVGNMGADFKGDGNSSKISRFW